VSLKDIPKGSRVFVDVNIFLYDITNHPALGSSCKAFLQRISNGELEGFVSVEVLNELLHRLVIGEVAKKRKLKLQAVSRYLKRNPKILSKLDAYRSVARVESLPNLRILEVLPADFVQARSLMQRHHLLSNDALHLAVMQRNKLDMLASKDADFQRVPWIKLHQP